MGLFPFRAVELLLSRAVRLLGSGAGAGRALLLPPAESAFASTSIGVGLNGAAARADVFVSCSAKGGGLRAALQVVE